MKTIDRYLQAQENYGPSIYEVAIQDGPSFFYPDIMQATAKIVKLKKLQKVLYLYRVKNKKHWLIRTTYPPYEETPSAPQDISYIPSYSPSKNYGAPRQREPGTANEEYEGYLIATKKTISRHLRDQFQELPPDVVDRIGESKNS